MGVAKGPCAPATRSHEVSGSSSGSSFERASTGVSRAWPWRRPLRARRSRSRCSRWRGSRHARDQCRPRAIRRSSRWPKGMSIRRVDTCPGRVATAQALAAVIAPGAADRFFLPTMDATAPESRGWVNRITDVRDRDHAVPTGQTRGRRTSRRGGQDRARDHHIVRTALLGYRRQGHGHRACCMPCERSDTPAPSSQVALVTERCVTDCIAARTAV